MRTEKYSFTTCHHDEENDIVFMEFPEGLKVNLEKSKVILASRLAFTHYEKHYVIIDLSNVREVSSEAKKFMQQRDQGLVNILGAALIAGNPVATLIANIFIKTEKEFQARFFSNHEDALRWIKELKSKRQDSAVL